jgi:hypothetical protein
MRMRVVILAHVWSSALIDSHKLWAGSNFDVRFCSFDHDLVLPGCSTLWCRWNSRTFPGLSRPFFSKFKDLELGKIFWKWHGFVVNNSVILIKITNVGTAGTFKDFYWFSGTFQSWNVFYQFKHFPWFSRPADTLFYARIDNVSFATASSFNANEGVFLIQLPCGQYQTAPGIAPINPSLLSILMEEGSQNYMKKK